MASPLIAKLQQLYPDSQISWLADPMVSSMIVEHDLLSEVIVLPKKEWKSLWQSKKYWACIGAIYHFVKILRRKQFDLVIDVQGLLKSAIWAKASAAKRRVGFHSKEGAHWLMTEWIKKVKDDPEISSEYKQMAAYLGCDVEHFFMDIRASQKTHSQALSKLSKKLNCQQPYVVICPFTTRPQKHWVNDYWPELAARIYAEYGFNIVILGGPADKENAETLCGGKDYMINYAGESSLLESTVVIANSALLIGVDTGMTHAGIAKAIPTIAIFGSTRPYLNTGVENTEVIYLNKECSPCRRNPTCDGRFDCLVEITPELVMKSVGRVLSIENTHSF